MKMRLLVALCAAGFAASTSAAASTTLLKTSSTWDGAEIEYFKTRCPEVHAVVVEIPANGVTPIHLHPVNNYAFILEGQVTVQEGDMVNGELAVKKTSSFTKGDAFAEVVNRWHKGTAGPEGVKILVWYTSEVGRNFTVTYAPSYKIGRDPEEGSRCMPSRGDGR